jgi:hypothetical protein
MRAYIERHIFGTAALAVILVALCLGWPDYDGVARANDAADDAILKVRTCIEDSDEDSDISDSLEEALIKADVIEKDLLQTKVTNGMCKEMLQPIHDGTPVRKLLTAQNYIQEINLIEGAMSKAADEAATRGTDAKGPGRHFLADKPLVLPMWTGLGAPQRAAVVLYSPRSASPPAGGGSATPIPSSPSPEPTTQPSPASAGGGSATASAGGGSATASAGGGSATASAGGDGIGGVDLSKQQAAAAASAGEDDDASIAERLRKKEAALKKEGASATEAAAGGRCSLEVDVLDEKADKLKDLEAYEIKPHMPKKMGQRESEQAGLFASPVTKEIFQGIRKKTREKDGDIAEASESDIHCVRLADQMKATLLAYHPEELRIDPRYSEDIRDLSSNQNTRWSWDIDPHGAGKVDLTLDLRYTISRKDQEFRQVPDPPVYDGVLKVTPHQSDSTQKGTEPWWDIW